MKSINEDRLCEYDNIIYKSDDNKLVVSKASGYLHFHYVSKRGEVIYTSDFVELTSILIGDEYKFDNDLLSVSIDDDIVSNITSSYDRVLISIIYGTNILDKINGDLDKVLPLLKKKFKRTINSLYNSKSIKDVHNKFIKKLNIAIIYEYLLHINIF